MSGSVKELDFPGTAEQDGFNSYNGRTGFSTPVQFETSAASQANTPEEDLHCQNAPQEVLKSSNQEATTCSAGVQCDILPCPHPGEAVYAQVGGSGEQAPTSRPGSGRRRVSFSERTAEIVSGQTCLHADGEEGRSPAFVADKEGPPLNFGESIVNRRPTPYSRNTAFVEEEKASSDTNEGDPASTQSGLINPQCSPPSPVPEASRAYSSPQPGSARRRVSFVESPVVCIEPRASCSDWPPAEIAMCAQHFLQHLYRRCGQEREVIRRPTPWPRQNDEGQKSEGLPLLEGMEARELSKAFVATLTDVNNVIEPAAAALVDGLLSRAGCVVGERDSTGRPSE